MVPTEIDREFTGSINKAELFCYVTREIAIGLIATNATKALMCF
jgi:hypothetical protein